MDMSEEIPDVSPCFIVPNSQASEMEVEENPDAVLRGLTALQPDQTVAGESSESTLPSSSSSDTHSHETSSSLTSSKEDSSGEKHASKEHALYITRFERGTSVTRKNMFHTSTPMVSSVLSPCHTVERLTPVEHNSTNTTPQQEKIILEKETSSSDDFISPSGNMVVEESSVEEPNKDVVTDSAGDQNSAGKEKDRKINLRSVDESSAEELIHEGGVIDMANDQNSAGKQEDVVIDLAKDGSSAECGVVDLDKDKSSVKGLERDDVIDLTIESSAEEQNKDQDLDMAEDASSAEKQSNDELLQEEVDAEHKSCNDQLPKSSIDENKDQTWNSLPRWVQDITGGEKTSPSIETLTRSSSDASTTSSKEVLSRDSSIHQWQSENDVMIETNQDCLPSANNQQASSVFQQPDMRSFPPLVLSQDIFQPKPKAVIVERATTGEKSRPSNEKSTMGESSEPLQAQRDPSRTDDVILTSQEDLFCLYLTESQSSSSSSQRRARNEKQTSPLIMDRLGQRETEICDVTPPLIKLSNTVLVPTPIGHPSTTGHHQDIAESQTVAAPPAMLLKPVPRSSAPSLVTNVEAIQEEIASTAEFRPISPDVITTSPDRFTAVSEKAILGTRLSLSAPVPDEESSQSTDEQEFHIKKDALDNDNIPIQPTPFARSVFTNVRERFQPTMASSPDDEIDPFEFADEIRTPPLRKRKQKMRREKSSKRRKTNGNDRIMAGNEDQVGGNAGTSCLDSNIQKVSEQSNKECFWKIVQTKIITKITKSIETETKILYTAQDGTVIKEAILRENSPPTFETTTEENETKEEVDTIQTYIPFRNDSNDELHKTARIGTLSNTTSPPLFPPSNSFSTSTSELTAGNISNPRDMISSPAKKYKRSLVIDNPRTSRRSSNSPLVLHEKPRMLQEGTRVLALWCDKHYYPGRVIFKCKDDAKFRINFDDGDWADIQEQCIIVVDYLPCDQPVMFCEKAGGEYVDGVIKGFYNNVDERGYKVLRGDKKVILCPRKNVMLSREQAAIFLSLRESALIQKSSESFDNSPTSGRQNVVTKVGRKSHEKTTTTTRSRQKDPPRKPLTDKNRKRKVQKRKPHKRNIGKVLPGKGKLEEKHKKENVVKFVEEKPSTSETPKSSRKHSGAKFSTQSIDNVGIEDKEVHASHVRRRLSTVMNSSPDKTHPIPLRSSPRKLNSKVVKKEDLILPTSRDLFRGYGFILTGSDVMNVENENSPQEEDHLYVREHVRNQIRTGGGEVLEQFLEDYPSQSCFLLSNACQTTAKYFNALVLGVPCLSHAWIRDCCLENRLISYKSYLLPAGKDLITQCLVEKQNYRNALTGIKVHLAGEEEFRQNWTEVLKDAGCEIIKKLPANVLQTIQRGEDERVCDVILVGDGHVVHSTIQKARLLGIPTVTIHWVKQCILTGARVDFNAHESFIYRVQDK
ncbi:uncharacterized protein LOC114515810 isoform X2 [Dendronephthya gigantea]|uniref:uncharacterized protein LOC114515810 isoform X2 n=1 Tax=Dendronephthya gigantea TaxID=151771 RepID=UPI00106A4F5B|nr:uncharacterized protein LOC114515810 isoform X2 [Dendronephthya gigantea]